ncbi:putative elongator complex protein 1 [Hypsibius exemplaris]|uniref:Elongator complex protein 1 n=1 Tax=Hypsibius exemplaris TaxID=2072580 RepID=A0A1W0W9F3_HYPEX|nr:putative elongator complex protein 1 [Hypsibius exemplaris]
MRNLRLLSESQQLLRAADSQEEGDEIKWLTTGASGSVLCGGHRHFFTLHEAPAGVEHQAIPPDCSHVVGAEFLIADNVLFLATSEGTLLHCYGGTVTDVVCHIPAGISAFRWSPDQEILVVTTNLEHEGGHLLVMTADWMPVVTEPLNPDDFGEQKPVTVGWGKKETQFHGSEGKEAAKLKAQLSKSVSSQDDLRPRISWRGDGQFFCVSTVSTATNTRVIRIYDRQGVLQGTSEPVNGLEWSLAWKPSGALIAATVELPRWREVVFFEKNGLRHGSFALPFPVGESTVKELQWNSSSEILLVWTVLRSEDGLLTDVIQLWTTGNYHWYCKQTFRFARTTSAILAAVGWSQTDPYKLFLVQAEGRLSVLEWTWDVCRSLDNSATVAVIDGSKLLLTSFAYANAPPPTSSHTLQFPTFVNQAVFSSTATSYELAVATDSRTFYLFTSNRACPSEAPILHKTCDLPFSHSAILFWCGKEHLAAVEVTQVNGETVWGVWTFSVHDETERELESLPSLELLEEDKNCKLVGYFDAPVYHFTAERHLALVYLKNGQVLQADLRPDAGKVTSLIKLQPDCDKIVIQMNPSHSHHIPPIIYTLNSSSHKLHRSNVQVSDDCTSFILTPDFLLYTTHHHKLVAIPIHHSGNDVKFGSSSDERQLERGSRLVTTVASTGVANEKCSSSDGTAVILQLPRGNLEIIHPRALVIGKICDFLRAGKKNYRGAFNLMRKHRINMNLLVDFDLSQFLQDVPVFLAQIGNSVDLNIFIAELSDENVTATMYKSHFPAAAAKDVVTTTVPVEVPGKSNRVLDALEKGLDRMPGNELFLSRMACHIYKKPQELEQALFKVMELMKSFHTTEAEDALKFILYSTNVDELYNVALGTYDFDLVLMVAAKSRKDPKEYIPFLNQFRSLQPEAYQKFSIDNHLKRYAKALGHLASMGREKFTECVELVVQHQLYREALVIFREQSEERAKLLCLYGDFLSTTKRKYGEAAILYDEAGNANEAVENYRKSLDWQLAMACAAKANWDAKTLAKSADLTALALKSAGRHFEASRLLLDYTGNVSGAFGTLLEGRLWSDAHLLLEVRDCGPTARSKFGAAIADAASGVLAQIGDIEAKVDKYQPRLKVARQIKRERKAGGLGDEFIDNMSETSSVSERSSMRSSKFSRTSSKNRRKDEKKKRSLREGGPYEDLALLDALKALYRQTETLMTGEVASLLKYLLLLRRMDVGCQLQRAFGALLKNLQRRREEIWTMEELSAVLSGSLAGHTFGPDATTSSIVSGLAASAAQDAREPQPGDLSLTDLALYVPPDFNLIASWNEMHLEQFE